MMMKDIEFMGYRRPIGRPGIRNYLLVLNATGLTQPSANRVHGLLVGSVLASTPYGMGSLGCDSEITSNTLCGICLNPNVGAVLVLSADRPRADVIGAALAQAGKPFHVICFDDVAQDNLRISDEGLRAGARLMREISRQRRESFGLSELCVGLECGLSDPTSGIAANPLLGRVSDRIVASGGTSVLGETIEWLGTEDEFSKRATTAQIGKKIEQAVLGREKMAQDAGIDLAGTNPNRINIEAGLTTIEEKASGSVAKSGTAPISGIIAYGDRLDTTGLFVMDAPAYSPESLTGFVAAGAQIILFTTGVGNSYVSAVSPTIKVSANPQTIQNLPYQIDFDCSAILDGASQDAKADSLLAEIVNIADGAKTWGEVLSEGSESISRHGAAL